MGTARAPVFGSGRCPACSCRVSNPKAWSSSECTGWSVTWTSSCSASSSRVRTACGQEAADGRGLPGLPEQEAVMTVRRVDDLQLHGPAQRLEGVVDLAGGD